MLVSLIPRRSEGQWWNGLWDEPPPSDAISTRMGRPHLTWVFVGPAHASCGIGSQLLARAVAALDKLGYTDIASTFLVGNDPSVMWHWRNGFRLLRHAASCRIE
jgi:GNAT superfamily N-acetyltransferase